MKATKHGYYLINDLYYEYWIIPNFSAGRKKRFTTVVNMVSHPVVIGRELTLAHSKKVVEEDIKTKAKKRYYRELNRICL